MPALREFLDDVSTDSLRERFFGEVDRDRAVALLAPCSEPGDLALVAQVGREPSIVAHGASYRLSADRAEVAFLVADLWQGHGLGSIIFSRLAAAAREQGVTMLVADVLPTNRSMLTVFERSGYAVHIRPGPDVWHVQIEITTLAAAAAAAA